MRSTKLRTKLRTNPNPLKNQDFMLRFLFTLSSRFYGLCFVVPFLCLFLCFQSSFVILQLYYL